MMHVRARRCAALALAASLALPLQAPLAAEVPPLTLEQVMADPDWIGNPPVAPYWSDDGRAVFYERKRDGEERRDLFRIDLASGKAAKVEDARRGEVDAPGGDLRRDRKAKVYAREGDIFFKDLVTGKVRQLTRTAAREENPEFLADGNRVAFHIDTDVFLFDLTSGLTSQAADLRLAKDPDDEDEPTFLSEQQKRLFEVIREKQRKEKLAREQDRAARTVDPTRPPIPFYLGEEVTIEGTILSPSGDWLLAVTAAKRGTGDKKASKMPVWVTESGQIEVRDVRAKVGLEKPLPQTALLFDLRKHLRKEIDVSVLPGIKDDPLQALRDAAKARKEAAKKKRDEEKAKLGTEPPKQDEEKKDEDTKGEEKDEKKAGEAKGDDKAKPRPLEVVQAAWSGDGRQLSLFLDSADNKDRWLATYDTAEGKLTPRHRITDPAWINDAFDDLGWLGDNRTVYFLSEETGYSHLYLLDTQSGQVRPLTEGKYEVSNLAPSFDRKALYYRANQGHPGIYEMHRIDAASGKSERITHLGGFNFGLPSLDEAKLLVLHSSVDRPDELYTQDNRPDAPARQITQTRSEAFLAVDWVKPEVVAVPSTHGATAPIYARVYTPPGFDAARPEKYPAVVFIHGAGYLQNAHFGWSSYFREFMFHTVLARRGYVVLDMDYRASAGYGRDWRTAIYRQMGKPEVEDLADGVAWLAAQRNVDASRVGTYGGSYGGFLTFMALFTQPDLFAAGAALRPVTDWAHYNEGYTSNILNTPELDPEAYDRSSPIEYAAGLTKPLLICHGMVDDNVFSQDTVRIVQRLIELKKENFETALYPVEPHGFLQPTSWLDEYRRIYKLFEANLR
jgi:dipeptidyl aminopeptidase/acylaminoacyl peptidase